MAKQLDKFGGWLRFFQITNIVTVLIIIVVALFMLLATAGSLIGLDIAYALYSLVSIAELGVALYFTVRILKLLPNRSEETPDKIRNFLKLEVIFMLIFTAVELPLSHWADGGDSVPDLLRGAFQGICYFVIWSKYFGQSLRVHEYYSEEARSTVKRAVLPESLRGQRKMEEVVRSVNN